MMTYIRNKKQFVITKENRQRILKDIDDLANLPNGVFAIKSSNMSMVII